jgi:prepilin-type N-terminal cleavage/methylation domain-containing protein
MKRRRASFTLIELLVVIAIIGVLTGFVFVSMQNATNSAKDGRRKFDVATITKAILMNYASSNNAPFPIESSCNIGSNCDSNFTNYIPSLPHQPTDPQSGYYTYDSNGTSFTVCATLSNGHTYCYDSGSGDYAELIPVNGICGADTNLCSGGNLANASGSSPSWTWDCAGIHGGTTSHCGAQEFLASGSWAIPATTNSFIYLAVVGAGGGGGCGGTSGGGGGGGGGGSGYQTIQTNLTVQPSASLTITIGQPAALGSGGGGCIGGAGGTTSITGGGISFSEAGGGGGGGWWDASGGGAGGSGQCNGGSGGSFACVGGQNGSCSGGGLGGAGGPSCSPYYEGGGGGGGGAGYGSLIIAGAGGNGTPTGAAGTGGQPGTGYGAGGGGGGGKGPNGGGAVAGLGGQGYVKFIYQY